MDGTVIHNPKDTTGIVVGRPRHHWFDPPIKRRDSVFGLTPAENSGRVDIQGTEVNPSSAALVLILDASGTTRLARLGGMKSAAGLNASSSHLRKSRIHRPLTACPPIGGSTNPTVDRPSPQNLDPWERSSSGDTTAGWHLAATNAIGCCR